jgi:hypothetical protein
LRYAKAHTLCLQAEGLPVHFIIDQVSTVPRTIFEISNLGAKNTPGITRDKLLTPWIRGALENKGSDRRGDIGAILTVLASISDRQQGLESVLSIPLSGSSLVGSLMAPVTIPLPGSMRTAAALMQSN